MNTSTDRILVTHVGSLPRSQDVVDLLARREGGEATDDDAFYAEMRAAVADVVQRQQDAGIDIVSDGEQAKVGYANYIKDRFSGFSGDSPGVRGADLEDFPDYLRRLMKRREGAVKIHRPCCTGPIRLRNDRPLKEDIANLQAAARTTGAAESFMNAASPGVIAVFQPNQHYPSHAAYLEALADAMRHEYKSIVDAGVILQIDCPDLAMGRHVAFKHETDEQFLVHVHEQIEALNHALDGLPADRIRMHLCWGNYEGPHHHDIDLKKIFSAVMKARPQALLFEAANPRHAHEWAVFEAMKTEIPADKILIPGVIQSSSNYIEHPELVAQRLERFASIVGRERVMAGSDCGFSTFAGDGLVDPEIVFAKLRACADGARIASDRLWQR
ncbi:MAG: cobalamin-independent methionine synthase II family protein [Burkholderiaceae bacterium]